MAGAVVEVSLLSAFAVKRIDGTPAGSWSRPYAKRLVQLLALRAGHRMGREELAAALFPELRPDRAANSVSKALTLARHALEGEGDRVLAADRSAIWIDKAVDLRTDLEGVQRLLKDALALPAGTKRDQALAAGLAVDGELLADEPYAGWADASRERLRQLREQARLELARDRSRGYGRSDPGHVIEAWTDVFTHDAANEEAAAALMQKFIGIGERDRAIRTYHRCRAALRDELAVDPSDDIQALLELARVLRPRAVPTTPSAAPTLNLAVVGRERLVDDLVRRLSIAPDHRGAAVLVSGVAGIGKTHLVEAVAQRLESAGRRVLRGAAVPDDRRSPHASLISALRPLAATTERLLNGLPLAARLVGADNPAAYSDVRPRDEDRARLAAELSELLERAAARSGLLLGLDDSQWMDAELQSLLTRLASLRPAGCSILISARSDEPNAPVPPWPSSVEHLVLGPLGARPIRTIVRSAVPAVSRRRRLLEVIVEQSQGVPFFAIELARNALAHKSGSGAPQSERIPATITNLLRSRISQCSPQARRILPLIALSGRDAGYELLLSAGSTPGLAGSPERCIKALDELVQARILHETGRGVSLAHPLLRDATLATITGLRRGSLHTLLADELDHLGLDDTAASAMHRLSAFEAAGLAELAPAAAEAGFKAGMQARALFADDTAAEFLKGGLAAYDAIRGPQRELLRPAAFDAGLMLGLLLVDRRDEEAAEAVLTVASRRAVTDDEVGRAWLRLGDIPYGRGDMAGTAAVYEAGLAALALTAEPSRSRLKCLLSFIHYRLGEPQRALKLALEAEPMLARAGDAHYLARCLDYQGISCAALGQQDEALDRIDRAVGYAQATGDRRFAAMVTMHRGMVLTQLGRGEDALQELAIAAAVFEEAKDAYLRSVCHWQAAEAFESLGRLEEALAERDLELRLLAKLSNPRHLGANEAHRESLLNRLGRPGEHQAARAATPVEVMSDQAAPGKTPPKPKNSAHGKSSGRPGR